MTRGLVLVLLCGCGARSELDAPPEPRASVCGDAVVDPDEACDLGDENADRPAIVLIHGDTERPVMPVDGSLDVVTFYDYASESSHTGFEGVDRSVVFLYRDVGTERLSLVLHHGIDEDSSGMTLDHGLVKMTVEGLPPATEIALADEPHDEISFSGDELTAVWEFWRNSDGIVLSPLPFPGDWTITLQIELFDGITRWRYVDAPDVMIPLDPGAVAILRSSSAPSRCRLDCSEPRCGDGVVDGGEICDDGNGLGGDGCAADCLSLD